MHHTAPAPPLAIDFSIVIPSFKDPRILETIESINQQTYPRDRIEVVVMDGGSNAELLEGIRRCLRSHDVLVSEPDRGIFDALNKGISRASGAVVFTLGSDDKLAVSDAVAAFMTAFEDPQVQYVCAGIVYTGKSWKPIRDWPPNLPTFANFLLGRQVAHFGFACRPGVYAAIGNFNLRYPVAADHNFFLRLAKRKLRGAKIERRLVFMRLGGNSSKNISNVVRGNWQNLRSGFSQYGVLVLLHFLGKPFAKAPQFLRAIRYR